MGAKEAGPTDAGGGVIGVVGASARAAVMSLARAGLDAWAVDLFADRDLKRIAPCVRCPLAEFPEAIPELAARFPPGPFLYTGGLENYPDLVGELARHRPLLGNGPEVLRRVRDPFRWANVITHTPVAYAPGSPVPETGRWLLKSLRSSGGLGVRLGKPGEVCPLGCYLQEFIDGPAMSAVFKDREMLGVTEQLIGTPWLHAKPFHYAGTLYEPLLARRAPFANLIETFGLSGHFGIDFILNDGTAYVIEVNPRHPASLEAIEHALYRKCAIGKAIYFAPQTIRFPAAGPWDADLDSPFDPWRLPGYADIPDSGEPIEAGSPVLTFFASGSSIEECRKKLQSQAAELDELFC